MGKLLKHSVIDNVPFWVLTAVAIVMGIIAFFLPPAAVIDPSVLKFISWLFAFAAIWTVYIAMMKGIDAKLQHGKTSLTVGSLDAPSDIDTEEDEELEEDTPIQY